VKRSISRWNERITRKRWKFFAGKVKQEKLRLPAFQEEFTIVVPGWRDLAMK
jgi:hypothetical protein